MKLTIGIVDDHQLFSKSLALLLESLGVYEVILDAKNGADLQEKLRNKNLLPQIMLVDVNMPVMDGVATAIWMTENFPACKLVALTTVDTDKSIIKMIKAGCYAYLLKDIHPVELGRALQEVWTKGYYNADQSNINFRRLLEAEKDALKITGNEQIFLKFACSDLTYKQIADKMGLSERTIDGFRESLFQKLKVQSRVGMALEAIRKELVKL
ncbi:MAG: response regulator transcription factor [Ferruginibacter sp.]